MMINKNKPEVIAELAEKLDVTKVKAEEVLQAFVDVIEESVANGDKITLTNFMTIDVVTRKARIGHNPQNPEEKINIPEKQAPRFKFGKRIKDLANGDVAL